MNDYFLFIIAIIPIIFLIIMLGVLNKPAYLSGLASVVIAAILSVICFDKTPLEMGSAILEGIAYGLWPIMITIIAALFTYYLAEHNQTMETIKNMLAGISGDLRIQVLIIAWAFGGFLEGVAGYGTAVALPASLLVVLGFKPMKAAVLCLVANTIPTAFGAIGIPVIALSEVTGLDISYLSSTIVLQTIAYTILIPFILVILTNNSIKSLRGVIGITLVSGVSFAVAQYFVATYVGAELPSLIGGLVSLVATIATALIFYRQKDSHAKKVSVTFKAAVLAWLPYIFIVILILLTTPLFPALYEQLATFKTSVTIYQGEGATATTFKWLTTPGVIIIVATVLAGLIQKTSMGDIVKVFMSVCYKMRFSTVTVLAIVSLAKIMDYSGMVDVIATVLVAVTGTFFPLIAPFLGALGTFITGSDTSANLLFGPLQQQVAKQINVNEYWLAAANTSGATLGKMISPQSIAVAASATGLIGKEGHIISTTIKYCLGFVIILGIIIYLGGMFL